MMCVRGMVEGERILAREIWARVKVSILYSDRECWEAETRL
jgi:hypothetical protein